MHGILHSSILELSEGFRLMGAASPSYTKAKLSDAMEFEREFSRGSGDSATLPPMALQIP